MRAAPSTEPASICFIHTSMKEFLHLDRYAGAIIFNTGATFFRINFWPGNCYEECGIAPRYTALTAALTGRDPTGITVSRAARRFRFLVMVPTRSTATSP